VGGGLAVDVDVDTGGDVVVVGLEVVAVVEGVLAGAELDEMDVSDDEVLDEPPPPHPATATAATTRMTSFRIMPYPAPLFAVDPDSQPNHIKGAYANLFRDTSPGALRQS